MKKMLVKLAMLVAMALPGVAIAQRDPLVRKELETEKLAVNVVARVADVFVKDVRYDVFHGELTKKLAGVPPLEEFKRDHQWVTVISTRSTLIPGMFKGWGPTSLELRVGDIVEMRVAQPGAKSYSELGTVTKILCKGGAADYAECVMRNPVKMLGGDGNETKVVSTLP